MPCRCGTIINGITYRLVLVKSAALRRPSVAGARVIRRAGSSNSRRSRCRNENTAERRYVGSEIAQKQTKYEQADPEIICGINEETCKCPRVHNESFHCPRGHMAVMGRGMIRRKCGK